MVHGPGRTIIRRVDRARVPRIVARHTTAACMARPPCRTRRFDRSPSSLARLGHDGRRLGRWTTTALCHPRSPHRRGGRRHHRAGAGGRELAAGGLRRRMGAGAARRGRSGERSSPGQLRHEDRLDCALRRSVRFGAAEEHRDRGGRQPRAWRRHDHPSRDRGRAGVRPIGRDTSRARSSWSLPDDHRPAARPDSCPSRRAAGARSAEGFDRIVAEAHHRADTGRDLAAA